MPEGGQRNDWHETGVPHLDRILGGGLLKGSLVMVVGAPGLGKTILAAQIAFHHAARGGTALYLTGYSESHDKLLAHCRTLSFFQPELIGTQIHFANLLDLLQNGVDETEEAIVATARSHRATLVVLDGFKGMRQLLPEGGASAHFLYAIGAKLALLGATTLVAIEGAPDEPSRYSEVTISDVILALHRELIGNRRVRRIEVLKARGAAPLEGLHPFVINQDGITVFPRFESTIGVREPSWSGERIGLGDAALDKLVGGGLHVGTTTLAIGSPGAGKTLLGLQFTGEGLRLGEPTLLLTFIESAAQLRAMAGTFGRNLAAAEVTGQLRIITRPSYDLEADELAQLITEDVERRGVRRLVVDSLADLERAIGRDARKPGFLAALVDYLRSRNVTTYGTLDIPTIVGQELDLAGTPVSVLAENLLLLRSVEYRGELHRVISVLKMRFSDHERTIQEYTITAGHGIRLLGPAPLGEGLLTGLARPLSERTGRRTTGERRRPS